MPPPGPSDRSTKGFVWLEGRSLMSCTLCWAAVSLAHLDRHLRWHEDQEGVPVLLTRYPPVVKDPDSGGT